MANALESASLVMIPSGYEDGTLGSLKPTDGSGDFTFSRGSDISATRVNADGYIEKGYENLLTYSNTFSDAAWSLNRASVTGGQVGYDGTNDAWLLNRDDINTDGVLIRFQSLNSVQTLSVYAKANTLNWIRIRIGTGGRNAYFDLSNGTTPTSEASIESVGNGWYRCSIWDSYSSDRYRIYPADGDNDTSGTSGSIYIQDAMLNQGLVAYPYKETTTAPVAGGILEDMPRLDYSNGSCPSLKLEPQRTNLIAYSEYYTDWGNVRTTNEFNVATSPEGLENASILYDSAVYNTFAIQKNYTASSGTSPVVFSVFAKKQNLRYTSIRLLDDAANLSGNTNNIIANYDLENGVVTDTLETGTPTNASADIEDYGNGWYRLIISMTKKSGITRTDVQIRFENNPNSTASGSAYLGTGNDGYYFYGLQLEEGSYPTSYIPTYGVSQTRLRDDITIPSSADLSIPSDSWTILWDVSDESVATGGRWFDDNLQKIQLYPTAPNKSRVYWRGIGQYIASAGGSKIIARFDGTTATEFHDGINKGSASYSGQLPFDFYTALGADSGKYIFNKFIIFPTALTDSECIELTTI